MESTGTKMEVIKPVLLKAGIPLAVTVAGFIIARITQRKASFSPPCLEIPENSPENESAGICRDKGLDSETLSCEESCKNTGKLLQEEITKLELLEREISMLKGENESQRFENIVTEFLKIMELLEFSRSENVLLHRKVKRLQKKIKHLYHVVYPKNLQLRAKEAEISRNQAEVKNKDDIIKKIEEDFRQVKMALEQLQPERDELKNKLELVEKADSSKNYAEMASMDDYKELVHELEQLQESKAAEEKELVYLRWCNACLRHELMRRNQEDENQSEINNNGEIADFASDLLTRSSSVGHHESCLGFPIGGHSHDHSKRKKLVQKFKKWSEKMKHKLDEKEKKHETKYSANHSHSAGDLILPAGNSFSSV